MTVNCCVCRSWSVWTRSWRRRRWSSRRWCWSWRRSRNKLNCENSTRVRSPSSLSRWRSQCLRSVLCCVCWRQRPGRHNSVAERCRERERRTEQFDGDAAEIHRGTRRKKMNTFWGQIKVATISIKRWVGNDSIQIMRCYSCWCLKLCNKPVKSIFQLSF